MRCIRSAAFARALLAPVASTFAVVLLALATPAWAAKPRQYEKLSNIAEAHVSAGRVESALIAFADAAKADPTRKEPWVRSAQLLFDAGRYGRAIIAAEEVLQRDPQDRVADSVLTVAGMRLAGQSLQRLHASGALSVSDTARREAEQLVGAVREALDKADPAADVPKPTPRRTHKPRRRPAARTPAKAGGDTSVPVAVPQQAPRTHESMPRTATKPATGGGNPFDVLGH